MPNDYLLAWNAKLGHWETHTLQTITRVTENQCMIYKLIRSITALFNDDACPGLAEEMGWQDTRRHGGLKYVLPLKSRASVPLSKGPGSGSHNVAASVSSDEGRSRSPCPNKLYRHDDLGIKKRHRILLKQDKPSRKKTWPTHFSVHQVAAGLQYIIRGRQQDRGTTAQLYQ